jgi:hypothetical protein
MPPLETSFEASSLRHGSSLYDNLAHQVNALYLNASREKLQLAFSSKSMEDVVATREILVGKHPLADPETPEWDECVLGKEQKLSQLLPYSSPPFSSSSPLSERRKHPSTTSEKRRIPSWRKFGTSTNAKNNNHHRSADNSIPRVNHKFACHAPANVLEWLELFTGICNAGGTTSSSTKTNVESDGDMEDMTTDGISVKKSSPLRQTPIVSTDMLRQSAVHESDDTVSDLVQPVPRTKNRNRVLYPIARYPSRLNSPRLGQQRRKFLEKQVNFKPLSTA